MTNMLVRLFVKDFDSVEQPQVRRNYGLLSGTVGIVCNLILFAAKFFAGILTGAISITADAFNNLSDAGSSIITLIGFQMAGKPADEDHPFGHGRGEYITGLFVSVAILLMGFELMKTSIQKIIHPEDMSINLISIGILILSIIMKFWMSRFNRILGDRIQSASMKATATDSLSDCIATASVLVGLIISQVSGYNLDGFIGVLVALFILFAGYSAAKDTISPLLGQKPDPEFVQEISKRIMARDELIGFHDMVIHNYGPGRVMVSVHGEVPYHLDIMQAHDVIDDIEAEIKRDLGCEISIHMDPVIDDDDEMIALREQVEVIVKQISPKLSIHDFRMTRGPLRSNLIFDVVVPFDFEKSEEDITNIINEELHKLSPQYVAVIQIDHMYL
ncbi:MAG: cation diffusion facilitator family transporter [Lachnospiraceae bacterium]|nr:cation diffusion facilitator family transporter [Lachnospiraceae bacterium]